MRRARAFFVFLTATACFIWISGCSVLTTSQINEVRQFIKASDEYNELPGSLAQSYGILQRNNTLLEISGMEFGLVDEKGGVETDNAKRAWNDIKKAYKVEQEYQSTGQQMNEALTILKTYSQLLAMLVSDDYTDKLSKNVEGMGKSIDEAVNSYNNKFRTSNPLRSPGGDLAGLIRGVGGIYIRNQQEKILQDILSKADPLVKDLMSEVENIALKKMKPSFVNYEDNVLGKSLKSVANSKGDLQVGTIIFVYDNLSRVRQGIDLSDRIARAAHTYMVAHEKLIQNTRTRMNLNYAIAEIEALKKEVEAAKDIREKIVK